MKTIPCLLSVSLIAAAMLSGCADSKKNDKINVGDVTVDIDEISKE